MKNKFFQLYDIWILEDYGRMASKLRTVPYDVFQTPGLKDRLDLLMKKPFNSFFKTMKV
jgi:hypothetical protein